MPRVARLGVSLRGVRRLRTRLVELCASPSSPFRKHTQLLGRDCPPVQAVEELTTTQLVHLWVKEAGRGGALSGPLLCRTPDLLHEPCLKEHRRQAV